MNNNTYVHKYLKPLITDDSICADMTMGNGNDTLFLCQHAKKVYAFDISKEALVNTAKRLEGYTNHVLVLDSHANADKYIKEKCDFIIFNLGYLPKAVTYSVTEKSESLAAVKKSLDLLSNNGYLIITFYTGHPGGKEEYELINKYINDNKLNVIDIYFQEKENSPISYIIKKRGCKEINH